MFVVSVTLVACAVDPITGRRTLQLMPESQINAMGIDAYKQTLAEAKVSTDRQATAMIERVGKRIAAVVDEQMKADGRTAFEWEFRLIDEPTVNAWCLPGGKVAFYTGILPICLDENRVAVVMGHEIAHAYAGHGNNRMSLGVIQQYGLAAVAAALSSGGTEGGENAATINQLALQALGAGSQLGVLAFGRKDESHADQLGLRFMARAGYDPSAAAEFWKRMAAASGGESPPEFFSTHPSHDTRISDIESWLPEAMKDYEATKK